MVQSTLHVYYTPKKATSIIAIMIYKLQIMKQYQHPAQKIIFKLNQDDL